MDFYTLMCRDAGQVLQVQPGLQVLLVHHLDAGVGQQAGGQPPAGDRRVGKGAVVHLPAAAGGGPGLQHGHGAPVLSGDLQRPLRPGPVGGGDVLAVLGENPAVGLNLGGAPGDVQPPQQLGTDGDQVVPRPMELDNLPVQPALSVVPAGLP